LRYLALAADYDGTLATDGRVDQRTVAALERLRSSGRRLVLVTGRELDDLLRVFERIDLCDRVVAENGAVLYDPAARAERPLADPPPERFIARLRERGVAPLAVGRSIVATTEPHEVAVVETIRELGLELHVVFNKGSVMVLPSGVNKATGLAAALAELCLSPHNAVGVGDAENDHAFLAACECAAAVANALPAVKEHADLVTRRGAGAGVVELVERLIDDDLADIAPRLQRHRILLGRTTGGRAVGLEPHGTVVLVAGPSASGKSTVATAVLERVDEAGRQFCLIDPEGDYPAFAQAVRLGDPQRVPAVEEVLQLLEEPGKNVVVNLLGVPLADRPAYFATLLPHLLELRTRTGRPHWLVVDEAHHLLPAAPGPPIPTFSPDLGSLLLVTPHPSWVAHAVLGAVDTLVAVGARPDETIAAFAAETRRAPPIHLPRRLATGELVVWRAGAGEPPERLRLVPGHTERQRHRRKYAQGDLGSARSFYFRGPRGELNLRAQNLALFVQIAAGVDDATWLHHLRRGDYSAWFRHQIKDEQLAAAAERVEHDPGLSPAESRRLIADAITRAYTAPAG
jgi:HAD superfamily hydrolase (TIGR01484 family)